MTKDEEIDLAWEEYNSGYYGLRPALMKKYRDFLVMVQDNLCFYCNVEMEIASSESENRVTVDHVVPRSRGGEDNLKNMVASCSKCNNEKGDQTIEEFREQRKQRCRIFTRSE